MKILGLTLAITLFASGASAAGRPVSPYAGQEDREIKALSAQEVEGLMAGKGLGFAKSAELNGYPGPAHVLDLAQQLEVTPDQLEATRALHAEMERDARALGAQLVAAEAELERLFRTEAASAETLQVALEAIASLQARLRGVHLVAHVEQRKLLSREQVDRYIRLRGYHDGTGHHHGAGHGH